MSNAPTETKVVSATGAAVGGGVLGTFVLWLLGVLVWGVSNDADHADDAIGAVPWPVSALLVPLVAGAAAFAGGYLARHTPRPPELEVIMERPTDPGYGMIELVVGVLIILILVFVLLRLA